MKINYETALKKTLLRMNPDKNIRIEPQPKKMETQTIIKETIIKESIYYVPVIYMA